MQPQEAPPAPDPEEYQAADQEEAAAMRHKPAAGTPAPTTHPPPREPPRETRPAVGVRELSLRHPSHPSRPKRRRSIDG